MLLEVHERLQLMNLIPPEGGYEALKTWRRQREMLALQPEETEILNYQQFQNPDGSVRSTWDINKAAQVVKEIPIDEYCTNHYRKRVKPGINLLHYRYPLMRRVLMAKTGRGEKVDFDIARKTMGAVRLPITVHTVIADLDTLDFWFAPGEFLLPPGNRDYVRLPVKAWLAEK